MSVSYTEIMNMSVTLYRVLCDLGPMASDEPVRAGMRSASARTGDEDSRAFYAAQAERSAVLAERLVEIKRHVEAAHETVNKIAEEFSTRKMAIRRKMATVHTLMTAGRKEGWMPKACLPSLKSGLEHGALDALCHGMPASAKEDLTGAVVSVYSTMRALSWLARAEEMPPLEEMRDLFRAAFGSVLKCKGVLGKVEWGIEKVWFAIKVCMEMHDLVEILCLDDLGQMMEILETMEGVLVGARMRDRGGEEASDV
jgi:hypothetical protein